MLDQLLTAERDHYAKNYDTEFGQEIPDCVPPLACEAPLYILAQLSDAHDTLSDIQDIRPKEDDKCIRHGLHPQLQPIPALGGDRSSQRPRSRQ